jgi:hypothetical protein
MEAISKQDCGSFEVTQLKYTTWKNFYGCASLFMPKTDEKIPLVFVLCGHGKDGRLSSAYVAMAKRLAEQGIAVMLPDNIGQGDRIYLGHRDVISPFYCGLTLQGLIVMETIALIRYMKKDSRFDSERIGSCGNSGGGTLNLFLAALAPELSAISSSGYPSEFSYVFSKERFHCSCNLLPGAVRGPEMWEILSVFAPKPMLLESGLCDALFPADYSHRNARKVGHTYRQLDAENAFRYVSCNTTHSWANEDRYEIAKFFSEVFSTKAATEEETEALDTSLWHIGIGSESLTVDALSERISGKLMPEGCKLSDIYKPMHRGALLKPEDIISDIGRGEAMRSGDVMRVLAQMECALTV